MRQKGRQYWRGLFDSTNSDTTQEWRHFDKMLGRKRRNPSQAPGFTAEDFHSYIDNKIQIIRDSTAAAGTVTYTEYTGVPLLEFSAPTMVEVVALVKSSPNSAERIPSLHGY